eukprot:scaffold4641_cov57-Skeletonema_menzelii.AAC.1
MNRLREYSHDEARAADVSLDEITSSANNEQKILQRLRDGTFNRIFIGVSGGRSLFTFGNVFFPRKIRFIGRSEYLGDLDIVGWPEDKGEEQQMIHTLCDAIARSRSIQEVSVELEDLSNVGFGAISRALGNSTQLERFSYRRLLGLSSNSIGSEGLSTLAAALTNCTHLERLDLSNEDFSMAAVGLRSLSDWLLTAA